MIHQVLGGIQGQASDIEITAKHMLNLREEYAQILVDRTSQKLEKVMNDIKTSNYTRRIYKRKYEIGEKR